MILACHQPQYLPWMGYFDKINKCDIFVILDDVQYKKREFQNRNKIRNNLGAYWLTVPVLSKNKFYQKVNEVLIDNETDWQRMHFSSIKLDYHKSPYLSEHIDFLSKVYTTKWDRLADLNMEIIYYVLGYLGINKKIYYSSDLKITSKKTNRIVDICKTLGAATYLSGSGGKDYIEEGIFKEEHIGLVYQDFKHPVYCQQFEPFIPNLSIIDIIFNCGKKTFNILKEV